MMSSSILFVLLKKIYNVNNEILYYSQYYLERYKKKVPCDDNSQYQKRRFSLLLASNVQPQTITEVYCIQFSYIQ